MTERLIVMGERQFTVDDFDEKCWVYDEERGFWDTFEQGFFDPQLISLIDRLVKVETVFVDVGAWLGAFTLYAAASGAAVVAIEPDPVAFAKLTVNAHLNEQFDLHLFPYAIVPGPKSWESQGDVVYLRNATGRGLSEVVEGGDVLEAVEPVGAGTLPMILGTAKIDPATVSLVKIDIEGFETTLMPELGPWLAKERIPLIVSLHGEPLPGSAFKGFATISDTSDLAGSIVALPFVTLDRTGLE